MWVCTSSSNVSYCYINIPCIHPSIHPSLYFFILALCCSLSWNINSIPSPHSTRPLSSASSIDSSCRVCLHLAPSTAPHPASPIPVCSCTLQQTSALQQIVSYSRTEVILCNSLVFSKTVCTFPDAQLNLFPCPASCPYTHHTVKRKEN